MEELKSIMGEELYREWERKAAEDGKSEDVM